MSLKEKFFLAIIWLLISLSDLLYAIKEQLTSWKLQIKEEQRQLVRELRDLPGQLKVELNVRLFQLKCDLQSLRWFLRELPGKIKRRVWNKYILMTWNRLYVRKDEFHPSLNMDVEAMLEMTPQERENYQMDLIRRRQIAHYRDLAETDPPGMVFPKIDVATTLELMDMNPEELERHLRELSIAQS